MVMRSKSPKRRPGHDVNAEVDGTRRSFMLLAAASPLLMLGVGAAAEAAQQPACYDPNALPANQKSMRRSLGLKPQAPDPKKSCGTCAFFTAAKPGCGKCALLSGGPVAAQNVCDSWAKKG